MSEVAGARAQAPAETEKIDSRRLAGNFALLAAAEFICKVFTFFAFTYLGRVLGAERYGSLEFAMAVMVFFTLPVDFGLAMYGAREVAKNRERSFVLLHEITRLRILLAVFSFALLLLFVLVIRKPAEVRQLLVLYGISLLAVPFFVQWFFQGHDRMQWVAVTSIARWVLPAVLVLLFVGSRTSLAAIGFFECMSLTAAAGLSLYIVHIRFRPAAAPEESSLRSSLAHLREAVPIGLSQLTWAFLWYFAMVLMGFVTSGKPLGWFGASHRAVMALHTFVWLYFFNLLPSVSRCVLLPRQELRRLMERSIPITAWSGIFVAFVTTCLAERLLTLAYGTDFAGAKPFLSLLVWIVPITMVSGHYRITLIGYNLQQYLLLGTSLAASVAVTLNFALVPAFGGLGAASALLIASVVEFALCYRYVRRYVAEVRFLSHLARPLAALAVSLAVFLILSPWSDWGAAFIAAHVYLFFMVAWEWRGLHQLALLVAGRAQ